MDAPNGNQMSDLVYKNTPQRDLLLTFMPPINKIYEKGPIYFIIPGGGWHVEERQAMIDFSIQSVEKLRRKGFAVVSIDYRVCGEGVVMRDIVTDCFDALRYISHFADILEVDRENFVLSGHSAGAHLALMLSYASEEDFRGDNNFDEKFNVKAVAVMSPPTILYDGGTHNLRDLSDVFNDCDTKQERESTSPITYVDASCPPTLLCAGTSDYLVFANSSERLYEKLYECKVPCEIKLSLGGGHCFEKIHDSVEPSIRMAQIQDAIEEFILKNMGK